MPWDDFASTDLAADDSLPTTVGAWLVERERLLAEIPLGVEFVDQTTASATYDPLTTFKFLTPDYGGGTFYLYLQPDAYVTPAGTGNFRINTTVANGTDSADIVATSITDAPGASKVLLSAANTEYTITVEGKVTGGNTLHVQMVDRITAWVAGS